MVPREFIVEAQMIKVAEVAEELAQQLMVEMQISRPAAQEEIQVVEMAEMESFNLLEMVISEQMDYLGLLLLEVAEERVDITELLIIIHTEQILAGMVHEERSGLPM
jgi:hypothetical protein